MCTVHDFLCLSVFPFAVFMYSVVDQQLDKDLLGDMHLLVYTEYFNTSVRFDLV